MNERQLSPAHVKDRASAAKVRFPPLAFFKVTLSALLGLPIFARDVAKIQNEIRYLINAVFTMTYARS